MRDEGTAYPDVSADSAKGNEEADRVGRGPTTHIDCNYDMVLEQECNDDKYTETVKIVCPSKTIVESTLAVSG